MKNIEMLKKNYEFRFVLKSGSYYSGTNIEAFAMKNNLNMNKIGIAIKTKLGKAVRRNYLKRIIKESYRKNHKKLGVGYNIVFLAKKNIDIKNITFKEIESDMIKILEKLKESKHV